MADQRWGPRGHSARWCEGRRTFVVALDVANQASVVEQEPRAAASSQAAPMEVEESVAGGSHGSQQLPDQTFFKIHKLIYNHNASAD